MTLPLGQDEAGLFRNRLHFCRCVIAIDPKVLVLYRFEVRVCELQSVGSAGSTRSALSEIFVESEISLIDC